MQLIEYKRAHTTDQWRALAERAGTTVAYLNQLAYGHAQPSARMAARLIRATDGALSLGGLLPDLYEAAACQLS